MSEGRWALAEKLAARMYDIVVLHDEASDGTPIYVALNPELAGCKSQGDTVEEAIANLNDARIDYIYSLLEDELPIPYPETKSTATGNKANSSSAVISFETWLRDESAEREVGMDVPTETRVILLEGALRATKAM